MVEAKNGTIYKRNRQHLEKTTEPPSQSDVMHLSMLSPRGGTPGICGAFDLFCLPHPREFDLESGPQGGDVCFFFARRTGS